MASQKNLVKLQHKPTGEVYYSRKNVKKLSESKLKLKKYSPKLRKHVIFEEVKKLSKIKKQEAPQAKKEAKEDKKDK